MRLNTLRLQVFLLVVLKTYSFVSMPFAEESSKSEWNLLQYKEHEASLTEPEKAICKLFMKTQALRENEDWDKLVKTYNQIFELCGAQPKSNDRRIQPVLWRVFYFEYEALPLMASGAICSNEKYSFDEKCSELLKQLQRSNDYRIRGKYIDLLLSGKRYWQAIIFCQDRADCETGDDWDKYYLVDALCDYNHELFVQQAKTENVSMDAIVNNIAIPQHFDYLYFKTAMQIASGHIRENPNAMQHYILWQNQHVFISGETKTLKAFYELCEEKLPLIHYSSVKEVKEKLNNLKRNFLHD